MTEERDGFGRLPPRCILEGLRSFGLKQAHIGLWYGVTRQAVSWALKYGREGWEKPKELQWQEQERDADDSNGHYRMRPYSFGEDGHLWIRNDYAPTALPPQSVIATWRRWGWSPEKIGRACERFRR